jgi:tetratricopeptide (TPR) repeat protein
MGSKMTPERWQKIKEILDATEAQPPARRKLWLRQACGGDEELLEEVESLLAHEDELDGFIEEPVVAVVSRGLSELETLESGERVGPYRLARLLGKGGMGVVYLATRAEDFEQRVALKLLNPGPAPPEAIRRFESERQILARLEHRNIARLLDGGTSASGVPYFAMEVVEGLPLDRYCDEKKLSIRQRLALVLDICSALQLAHQSLVIHRDLKPGNILVGADGVPKLLDFGIAKLLQPDGAAAALTTDQIFTLHYASPEQVKAEPIGTTSDVYSLGVVTYLLLTGQLPGDLESRGHFEMLRVICEVDPEPASVAAGKSGEPPAGRGEPRAWRAELAGDLDAILAKALRKEPAHRYASADKLAEDIRRYLENRPVKARQGNTAYRLGKYIRRHRLALATAAAVALMAIGFTAAQVYQLRETHKARVRAEGVSSFLVDLFQSAAPDRRAGKETTVRQLLDQGRANLEKGLAEDPLQRAQLALKLGEVYWKLGDYGEARQLFEEAIAIFRREGEDQSADLASAISNLGSVHYSVGDNARAAQLYRESIEIRRRLGAEEDLFKPLNNLATLLVASGELEEAEEIYRENLARRRASSNPQPQNLATSLRSLAQVLIARDRPAEAEPLLREALAIRQQLHGPTSTPVATVLTSLARVEEKLGRPEEARRQVEKALAIFRAELGEDHPDSVRARMHLAALAPPAATE